jgi:excisionase family DNA binding protein
MEPKHRHCFRISLESSAAKCSQVKQSDGFVRPFLRMTNSPVPFASAVLRTADAARYLALSPWLLRKLVHDGRVRVLAGKYWRFRVADLDAYLADSVL